MTFGKKDIKDRVNKMYGSYGIMIMITPLYSKVFDQIFPGNIMDNCKNDNSIMQGL